LAKIGRRGSLKGGRKTSGTRRPLRTDWHPRIRKRRRSALGGKGGSVISGFEELLQGSHVPDGDYVNEARGMEPKTGRLAKERKNTNKG